MREEHLTIPEPSECVAKYQPSRLECLRDYSINLRFLSVGCIIEVGCKQIPFTTVREGMKALNEYIANPWESRQVWEKVFSQEEEL
tara:strand:- start:241 stop:498 length:258 start_codon:yes stop_codon:yes gene_type:complete